MALGKITPRVQFEVIGYFKEFYVNGKFIGSININTPDREVFGYCGRTKHITDELIVTSNNRKIKPGTEVVTQIYPLNGKRIK